ncbi:MAG TPA: archaemetzincin family Zn-dependent metalloprotease [Candidatus Acidoferrales bacterium]|nr:archaemetzincin family Zn-dependent metalloprotease [Candidatus Acidoferrales bacterium]
MNRIELLPLGNVPGDMLAHLAGELASEFSAWCEILRPEPDLAQAFNAARQQYCSTQILASMTGRDSPATGRLLGITAADLYIPILTFVFGEAQLEGNCALVSTCRLRQEFYGLPPDPALLRLRLLKEAVHELGHTLGLTHCDDYRCVMASSHAVESIDLKGASFCAACRAEVKSARQRAIAPLVRP